MTADPRLVCTTCGQVLAMLKCFNSHWTQKHWRSPARIKAEAVPVSAWTAQAQWVMDHVSQKEKA